MALQELTARTVQGLGYELVEIERSAGGLLRITIDHPWTPGAAEQFVTVEDCEKVTRQLQFALEVEGIEYRRLEVSSPGIDRPLRTEADFERFVGALVDVTLKAPLGAAAGGQVAANRKKFRGRLERAEAGAAAPWQLLWSDEPPAPKPGQKPGRRKKAEEVPVHVLGFALDELREARLAPVVNFKGRGGAAPAEG
ncbi:ribosome maturation factor RimP [Pseudorhodoferax sp.]|uniref:ribosome maturation factor RimP n=1 Tax=Pseudorhodoferax sp. TaxID=1993553 RepID=UPI0039E22582